jgi:hypothetical protein
MVWYTTNGLITPTWLQGPSNRIQGTGGIEEWEDEAPADRQRSYKVDVILPD